MKKRIRAHPAQEPFIAAGHMNARKAYASQVRARVEHRFAALLKRAPFWRRWIVRIRVERVIARALKRLLARYAPPDAEY
jgi:hypothetical protein